MSVLMFLFVFWVIFCFTALFLVSVALCSLIHWMLAIASLWTGEVLTLNIRHGYIELGSHLNGHKKKT